MPRISCSFLAWATGLQIVSLVEVGARWRWLKNKFSFAYLDFEVYVGSTGFRTEPQEQDSFINLIFFYLLGIQK